MSDVTGIERTLVLLKPDAVARGLVGRVLSRLEAALLKIVAVKMVMMDAELTRRHYFDLEERFGAGVYAAVAGFMQTGPVIAVVFEGVDAIACVRKLVGATYPDQAAPGTIRGDLAHQSKAYSKPAPQISPDAKREIEVWFTAAELHDYQLIAQAFIC